MSVPTFGGFGSEVAQRLVKRTESLVKELAAQNDLIDDLRRGWDVETGRLDWALKQGILHSTYIEDRAAIDEALERAVEEG